MSNYSEPVERYFAAWNQENPARRRSLIENAYTPEALHVDPMLEGQGHQGIDAVIQQVHERFPGLCFRLISEIEQHHDRLRFSWELAPREGQAVARGTDFARVSGDRLESVTGFFDPLPGGGQ